MNMDNEATDKIDRLDYQAPKVLAELPVKQDVLESEGE